MGPWGRWFVFCSLRSLNSIEQLYGKIRVSEYYIFLHSEPKMKRTKYYSKYNSINWEKNQALISVDPYDALNNGPFLNAGITLNFNVGGM